MIWVWGKLSAAKWADAWDERFRGNPNAVTTYIKGGKSVRVEVYCETQKQAEAIKQQFGGQVRKLVSKDWSAPPPKRAEPIKIRAALLVTDEDDPAALKALQQANPERRVISIPPEMAFGTGDHATTSTCLRLLVDVARDLKRAGVADWPMADLGTGSGVLAIAARMLGSGPCVAYDFDPLAVKVAARNVVRNGVEGISVAEQDVLKWLPPQRFPVVAANLFSTVLIEAFPVIAKALAPGGHLVVSGILATQAPLVFAAAALYGLEFPEILRKGKWVTARGGWK
jgi:ribosomal protein L11 methyltransferase